MLLHTWAPQCLRAAGLSVVETSGWTNRSHGAYPDAINGIWHHDASPPGDSPGALNWMIDNWNNASANFWVNRQGVWYCVGTGVSWHAGVVESGMPNNFNAFGVETDQTVNEIPSVTMVNSVRRGFAALLKQMGRNANSLYFHKTVAPLRKQDPWLGPSSANSGNWLNELAGERNNVQQLMTGAVPVPIPPAKKWDDEMPSLITAQGKPVITVFGNKAVLLADGDSTEGFKTAGVPITWVTPKDFDTIWSQLQSDTDA